MKCDSNCHPEKIRGIFPIPLLVAMVTECLQNAYLMLTKKQQPMVKYLVKFA